uniref:Glucosidase 2 subunit beta n=1 Tax=Chromera velia CCMP2878 TaxID=1169474 RepID=A0A0G4GRC3_9ALVE|eukprot:Cvel_23035.t1-p1 / transcript=Cvel_23035.t1 / gene=Cvel_23035 / organism=Chromera_velia_CCMP2878 / gene_product=Glucosidase 2 subunit beta, putative / transcript_product=Glucosidase 2 subunit beta, putative / location=Cvel_scaffold2328:21894-27227(-) / protein_length=634 / sequence_SO=supercontig / SO=protein_coding / is_pseudo=false
MIGRRELFWAAALVGVVLCDDPLQIAGGASSAGCGPFTPTLPSSGLGDDFCDCASSKTDKGGPECSGVGEWFPLIFPTGPERVEKEKTFFCKNELAQPKIIPIAFVRDGVCDCCDGTDETPLSSSTGGAPGVSPCPNTCEEEGREERERLERLRIVTEAGLEARKGLVEKAHKELHVWAMAKEKLDGEKVKLQEGVRVQKEQLELLEEEAKTRTEARKTKEAEEEAAREKAKEGTQQEGGKGPSLDPEDLPVGSAGGEVKTDGGAGGGIGGGSPKKRNLLDQHLEAEKAKKEKEKEKEGDKPVVSEYARWADEAPEGFDPGQEESAWDENSEEESFDEEEDLEDEGEAVRSAEDYAHHEAEELEHEKGPAGGGGRGGAKSGGKATDEEENKEEEEKASLWVKLGRWLTRYFSSGSFKPTSDVKTLVESTQDDDKLLEEQIAKVRKELRDSEALLQESEKTHTQLTKALNTDFGPDHAYFTLFESCVKLQEGKYEYEICPFHEAWQREAGAKVKLGRFLRWEREGVMIFDHGQNCWQGPHRSIKVFFHCGPETKFESVDEPERCVYTASVQSPAACKPLAVDSGGASDGTPEAKPSPVPPSTQPAEAEEGPSVPVPQPGDGQLGQQQPPPSHDEL